MTITTLAIDGTWNDRDAAELTGLRSGHLLRTAALHSLTDDGLARVSELGVTDVIDLRSDSEVARAGVDVVPRHVRVHRLPIDAGDLTKAGGTGDIRERMVELLSGSDAAERIEKIMQDIYVKIVLDEVMQAQLARGVRIIAEASGATVVHCSAGKDRTGVLVALTAHIAGAPMTRIVDDYLFSQHAAKDQAANMLRSLPLTARPSDDVLGALFGVRQSYLDAALSAIFDNYGTTDSYTQAIGIDDLTRQILAEKLGV